jgi:hypothetical protein
MALLKRNGPTVKEIRADAERWDEIDDYVASQIEEDIRGRPDVVDIY